MNNISEAQGSDGGGSLAYTIKVLTNKVFDVKLIKSDEK